MGDAAFVVGSVVGQSLLVILFYWGSATQPDSLRRACFFGVVTTIIVVLVSSFGEAGSDGVPTFETTWHRLIAGIIVTFVDIVRVNGRRSRQAKVAQ